MSAACRGRGNYDEDLPVPISTRWVYPHSDTPPHPNRFEINVEPRHLERIYPDGLNVNPDIGVQSEYSNDEWVYSAPMNHGEYDGMLAVRNRRSLPHSPVSPNQIITGRKRMLQISRLPSNWVDYLFQTLYGKNKKFVKHFLDRNVVSGPYTDIFTPHLDKHLREKIVDSFKEIQNARSLDEIDSEFYEGWYDNIDDARDDYENLFLDTDSINIDVKRHIKYNKKGIMIKPSNKAETLRHLIKYNRLPQDLSPSKYCYSKSNQRRRTQRLHAKKLMKKQELFDAEDAENGPMYDGGSKKTRQNKRRQNKTKHAKK
jgi:hypothetical protein